MGNWLRLLFFLITDIVLVNLSVYCSLLIRFEGRIDPTYLTNYYSLIPLITSVAIVSLYVCRLYHRIWEYASVGELVAIIRASTYGMVGIVAAIYLFGLPRLPRSVYILSWVLINVLIGSSRMWWRLVHDYWQKEATRDAKRVLIVGAGDAGAMLSREMRNNPALRLVPIGFIDDDKAKQKKTLNGIPVLGTREDIPRVVANLQVQEIIVAMPSVPGPEIRKIVEVCRETPARVSILPPAEHYINGRRLVPRLRQVEMEDLLRREPVKIDLDAAASYLRGKVVLVTGAGGSIGSELCRQIAHFEPRLLVLVDNSENNLFEIDAELRSESADLPLVARLADVRDREAIERIFRQHRPSVVFHAAAYKHVPMMQAHPWEAFNNNVLGTRNVAQAADRCGASTFILISTDKAVNPSSVMGATKRMAELVIQSLDAKSTTRYAAVRFGNVLGSRGSVVPLFKSQIARGGPVTVTHPEMRRYFMTIPEAVQLVIQAGAMAQGGEIFVLDMGEPVKIVDLARDLIRLSGLRPDEDIEIVFTGIRPGEKLHEELVAPGEQMEPTAHPRIRVIRNQTLPVDQPWKLFIQRLGREEALDRPEVIETVRRLMEECSQATRKLQTKDRVMKRA